MNELRDESAEVVHACPTCGAVLERTCYHEGEDLQAVDMPARRAARLRESYAEELLADLDIRDLSNDALTDLADEIAEEIRRRGGSR